MISVVIPFYAKPELHTHVKFSLPRCLEPLLRHEQIKEIVVVDDGSPLNITIPQSSVIKHFRTEHQGLGAARNFGISKTTQPYILILDSDIIVSKHIIDSLVSVLNSGVEITSVNGVTVYVDSVWSKCEGFYWLHNESKPNKWWVGCGCMMVKREVFDKLLFDAVELSDEDEIFCRNVRRLGLSSVVLPLMAKHVFATELKTLKTKWYRGGKRVARSKTRTSWETIKKLCYSPLFGLKLSLLFHYPVLTLFIVVRNLAFFKGYWDARREQVVL